MDIDERLLQLQAVNMAAILSVCRALIEEEALSARRLVGHLEAVSRNADLPGLTSEARAVLELVLEQVRAVAQTQAQIGRVRRGMQARRPNRNATVRRRPARR
jgi:hypothetical protein